MDAPVPLGQQATAVFAVIDGVCPFGLVREWVAEGFAPVFMHDLGSEKERARRGPHQLLRATRELLAREKFDGPWGAGAIVRTADDAAEFAASGATWFSLELTPLLDPRAERMSLDELDAEIVALEDAGCFSPGWHGVYCDREFLGGLRLDDEALARAAVKFGRALREVEQVHEAVQFCRVGHGGGADITLDFSAVLDATTIGEFLFLAHELQRRGIPSAGIAPSFGRGWELGCDFDGDVDELFARMKVFRMIASSCGLKRVGMARAAFKNLLAVRRPGETSLSLDFTEHTQLAVLASLDAAKLRAWLELAREKFPFAAAASAVSITEDDVRHLPEVSDAELREVFLNTKQGRQLLLATFGAVRS